MEILVLEASTTSAKAMLYHTETGKYEIETQKYTGFAANTTDQDPEQIFLQLMAVGSSLVKNKKVDIIALSGTWHNIMLCKRDMTPATPSYMWSNTNASELCLQMRRDQGYVKDYYQKTGCMVHSIYPYFKLLLLRKKGWKLEDYYVISQGDYLTYRLTGQKISTKCLTSGSGLMNIHSRDYDEEVLAQAGLSLEQMFPLVDSDVSCSLSRKAAEMLGIKDGIPVIPTNSDGGLNQIGVGALRDGIATLSVGTSGAIRLTTPRPVIPVQPSTWCYLSPKSWLCGAATNGCCNCIDWAKESLFPSGTSYAEIESGLTDTESTPVFLPFLYGERCPGWNDQRTGGFMNIKGSHNAKDLYRAVQEGVLFNLLQCYQILKQTNGAPKEIRLSGGILKSEIWTQMCADIFDMPMKIDSVEQGSLMGGAVLAMEHLGLIDDIRNYCPHEESVILPDSSKAEYYRNKFLEYLEYYKIM